jgi:hypothetical protein
MQLVNTAVYAITALATIVTAIPGPVAMGEKFALFNGNHSVIVETGIPSVNPGNTLQVLEEGDVDCKGSVLREILSGSCDDAYRKVVPSNTYSTYYEYAIPESQLNGTASASSSQRGRHWNLQWILWAFCQWSTL